MSALAKLASDDGDERDEDVQSSVRITLGDLGVVVDDEPQGLRSRHFPPGAEPDDDLLADEAVAFLSALWARDSDPLYLYRKEISESDLLSREEEVGFAKEIETGVAEAAEALARWQGGLVRVLEALDQVSAGVRRIEEVVDCDPEAPSDDEAFGETEAADDLALRPSEGEARPSQPRQCLDA